MILFIGFIAAGPREAIQASPKWIDGLSAYEGDPVIRASDASTVAKYGTRVTEMLAGGHQKARSPLQIYHFQYAFYTMLARALLLKRPHITGILGYTGGLQPGFLARSEEGRVRNECVRKGSSRVSQEDHKKTDMKT